MKRFSELSLVQWVEALAGSAPTPAGGALALVTLAGAAALGAKMARLAGRDPGPFEGQSSRFLEGAQRDAETYRAARGGGTVAARDCLALAIEQIEMALALLDALGALFPGLAPGLAADVTAVERMGRAAARTLLLNMAVNLAEWSESPGGMETFAQKLEALKGRLEAP